MINHSLNLSYLQGTRASVDPLLSQIDEKSSLSKIPICRFAYPNFAKLISDNVLTHVLETERSKNKQIQPQTNVYWPNDQAPTPSLSGVKVGILGLGKLGTEIAKAFKVLSPSNTFY